MKKHLIMAVGVCILTSAIAFRVMSDKQSETAAVQTTSKRSSIKEKASVSGNYIGTIRPVETTRYDDVAALTNSSLLVVRAIVQQHESFVPPENERLIITEHQLLVQESLKGRFRSGDSIRVQTLGGRVQFEDGTTAELRPPPIIKDPEPGKSYVFFLRPHKSAYRLVGGPQGLFEIGAGEKIKPQARPEDALTKKYNSMNTTDFFIAIRESVTSRK